MEPLKTLPIIFSLFFAASIVAGCGNQIQNTNPDDVQKEDVQKEESKGLNAEISLNLTMDTAQWKRDKSIRGLIYSYPPELISSGGGDIDEGSYNFITSSLNPQEVYFRIFDALLVKCEFKDPAQCNIETNIPATPQEVYDLTVNRYKNNDAFNAEGDIKVGNTTGKKFTIKKVSGDTVAQSAIVFKSSKGVYTFEDLGKSKDNPELLKNLLSSVQVE